MSLLCCYEDGLTIGLVWRLGAIFFLKDTGAFGLLGMDFHISIFLFLLKMRSVNHCGQEIVCAITSRRLGLAKEQPSRIFLELSLSDHLFDEPGWRMKADKLY